MELLRAAQRAQTGGPLGGVPAYRLRDSTNRTSAASSSAPRPLAPVRASAASPRSRWSPAARSHSARAPARSISAIASATARPSRSGRRYSSARRACSGPPEPASASRNGSARLPSDDVVAGRLARHGRVAPDSEHVVDDLESPADLLPELAPPLALSPAAAEQRADLDRGGQQRAGLARDHGQVVVDRHVVARLELQVEVLPLDQPRMQLSCSSAATSTTSASGAPRSAQRSSVRAEIACIASPALIACASPQIAQTTGR